MITTSDKYKTAVNKSGRHFRCKIDIGGITYTGIKGLKIKGGTNSSDEITFGDTVSSLIEFTLTDVPKSTLLKGKKAIPYIGLDLDDGTTEWLKKGVYHLEKPIKTGEYIKITAYDNFSLCNKGFFTDLKGSQKIKVVLDEQCKKIGITFAGGADDVSYNVDKLKGMTMREAVGVLAAYCGKNTIMDSNGNLKFVWYTDTKISISPSRYADPLETAEDDTYINRLDCAIENEKSLSVGTGIGIYFSCPGMTQTRLNTLYDRIKGFTYRALTLDFKMAHPDIEAGDLIKVVDKDGTVYNVPLMEYEFSCDGGFYGSVISKGKSQEEQENEYKGPLQTKVERTYSDLISTKQLLADKITAYEGEFETINTNYLNVNEKLKAQEIETGTIKGDLSKFKTTITDNLTAVNGRIDTLITVDFNAVNAKIGSLEVDIEKVNTLLSGTVTAGSTQTIVLNAENTTIANALIKSAMIESLAFDKITGIDVNTTKLTVHSADGKSTWKDNTIQISDANIVRVQVGKDASGDYNMYVWDKTGKLMFDATGVTADGIQRPIIVDGMVSDNANISGNKINITSVIKKINENSTLIESSHILYDGKSLDVAFSGIETSVSTVTTNVNTVSKTVTDNKSKWDGAVTDASKALSTATTANTNANDAKSVADTANANATVAKSDASTAKTNASTALSTANTAKTTAETAKTAANTAKTNASSALIIANTAKTTADNAATKASNAKTTADSKAKVFTAQPTPPYQVGDLWVQGTSGVIMRCKTARASGSYTASDWERADKYTDDTKANAVDTKVTTVTETVKSHSTQLTAQDGKIATLITDTTQVKKDITATQGEVTAAKGSITTLQSNYSALDQSLKGLSSTVASHTSSITDFGTKITAVTDKATKLEQSLDGFKTTVSNTYATKTQLTTVDGKFANYSTTTAMNSAIKQKADEISATISKIETTANSTSSKLLELVATVDGINATVSKKTDKGSIISTINQSAETIKIQASRLELTGKVTIGMLDTSTQSLINGAAKKEYHMTKGTGGETGYFILASITISGTYQNQPIKITVLNRGRVPTTIWINFANADSNDPALSSLKQSGNANVYIWKKTTSVWNLYVQKSESCDALAVVEYVKGSYMSKTSVAWRTDQVSALPSGYIEAKQLAGSAEWCYNNDITYINGGKIYAGTVAATQIAANAVTSAKIAAGAITASKINVTTLSAITANLGTVTAGSLTSKTVINVTTDLTIGNNIYINQNVKGTKYIKFTANNWIRSWISSQWEYIKMQSNGVAAIGATGSANSASVTTLALNGKGETQINATDRIVLNSERNEIWGAFYVYNSGMHFTVNNKSVCGVTTGGVDYSQFTPFSSSNNCVLGYGGYNAKIGTTRIYGVEVRLIAEGGKELTFMQSADGTNAFRGASDFSPRLGTPSYRWYNVYLKNSPNVSSDKRLKTNFKGYDKRFENMFMDLKPQRYHLKDDLKTNNVRYRNGMIAQDVEQVMLKCGIAYNEFGAIVIENGEYSLSYEQFLPLTIHVVQKHENRIDNLERQLDKERQLRIKAEQKLNAIISGEIKVFSRAA